MAVRIIESREKEVKFDKEYKKLELDGKKYKINKGSKRVKPFYDYLLSLINSNISDISNIRVSTREVFGSRIIDIHGDSNEIDKIVDRIYNKVLSLLNFYEIDVIYSTVHVYLCNKNNSMFLLTMSYSTTIWGNNKGHVGISFEGVYDQVNQDSSTSTNPNKEDIRLAIKYLNKSKLSSGKENLSNIIDEYSEEDEDEYKYIMKVYNILKDGCVFLSSDDEDYILSGEDPLTALDVIYKALFNKKPDYSNSDHEVDIISTKFGNVVVRNLGPGSDAGYDYIFIPKSVRSSLVSYLKSLL